MRDILQQQKPVAYKKTSYERATMLRVECVNSRDLRGDDDRDSS